MSRFNPLVSDLLALRDNEEPFILQLSLEAARLLSEYSRSEAERRRLLGTFEKQFAEDTALIAAKLAGIGHLLSSNVKAPVTKETMEKSIALAARLMRDTARLAALLVQRHQDSEQAATAEKMFIFLAEMGRPRRWALFRRFDNHAKERMQAALDLLLRTNRARLNGDGTVEAIAD